MLRSLLQCPDIIQVPIANQECLRAAVARHAVNRSDDSRRVGGQAPTAETHHPNSVDS
jgi:hypothetical protein